MFLIPAIWNYFLLKRGLMPTRMVPKVILECMGVCASLYVSMPLSCALYPQLSHISAQELEPEIRRRAKNRDIRELVFNKGL